uniref:Glutamine-dependent NAD(+) synthetase n=1 Tax=Cyanothece sp. (strain PCC 7425 / ATCC 29141) TaxID=395961 RepID=B8HVE8_CYAP4
MKIAIAQLNPLVGDLKGNSQLIRNAAAQAVAAGAELLITPELALCGYPPRDLLIEPSFISALQQQLEQLAQQLPAGLTTLVGTVVPNLQVGGKPLFNSVALLAEGKIQQTFTKRLLPTYDVFDEDRYFEPGRQTNLLITAQLRIGVTICEDLWNDELFWQRRLYTVDPLAELASQGVDLILNCSASPFSVGKQQLRERILEHAARRYQQPIVYVNQVGGNDDLIFDGRSVVVDRQGEVIARAKAFESDLLVLEWDQEEQDFRPAKCAPQPEDEIAEIWAALVLGVKDYAQKCKFAQAVIGLSGGIDSALVAAIATAALGAENVLGVLMPSPYSSDHSISDALALAQNLGIRTQTLPIAELMQTYDYTLIPLFSGTNPGIAEENIQARIRGNLLMAIANKFGYLLISTGNKSEMAVGYCTLYGDMSGGLAAIADLPKTKVYAVCRWLNDQAKLQGKEAIPQNVLAKAPSAELKPGQTDQDSLPPYEVLDDILDRLIEQHQSVEEMVAAGHDLATVERVIQLVHRAEFKRRQAAPGLKLTPRAFGSGWRMPIAARPTYQI